MLVKHPHDLSGIHRGTAAQSDYAVGPEGSHLLRSCLCTGKCRIRLDIKEAVVHDPHLIKLGFYGPCVPVFVEEAVRYDKRSLFPHHCLQFVQCYRQAALLYVNLFRCPEPQHIFPSFRNSLDIQQVLYTYILGNAVSAP